jgi:hypothetical protein
VHIYSEYCNQVGTSTRLGGVLEQPGSLAHANYYTQIQSLDPDMYE